jgi:fumarate hydratase, class II
MTYRIEKDSLGEVRVPADALYGAQTQRAAENFPISGLRFTRRFIEAVAVVKRASALANRELGLLDDARCDAIVRASDAVIEGKHDKQFVLDIFQTGSGTSTNMNVNEVLAHLANDGREGKDGSQVHPNDHVNMSQSSNDVIPTAMHISARVGLERDLLPALELFLSSLEAKAAEFDHVLKSGRTHLMDATPVRLGQEFAGFAAQIKQSIRRVRAASNELMELPLGGTAVGTGINRHPRFPTLPSARSEIPSDSHFAKPRIISRRSLRRTPSFRSPER